MKPSILETILLMAFIATLAHTAVALLSTIDKFNIFARESDSSLEKKS